MNVDIEAVAFLILMQAAKSAQEDLKDVMANVKNINQQKQTMRSMMEKIQQESTPTRKDDDD